MLSLLIMSSILLAVVIGYRMKINVGFIAIGFSCIFGCFVLNMQPSEVIAQWPTSLFFFILMTSLFFGLAVTNGTMGLLSERLVYAFRKTPWAIPIAMWILSFIVSGLGAGITTVFAFMPPIILNIADRIKMDKRLAAVIVVGGAVAGGYSPISMCYVIVEDLLRTCGYTAEALANIMPRVAMNNMIAQVLIFAIVYLACKSWKLETPTYESAPAPFNSKQIQTLALIATGIAILVGFPILKAFMPQIELFARISGVLDPSLVFGALLVVALIFRMGNEKETMEFVPWSTLIMVSGAVMLIGVAKKAGAIDFLASLLANNLSATAAKLCVTCIAAFMSMFSGGLTVVCPTLMPIIAPICDATGVPATTLVSALTIGCHVSGVSPFSTGGAMTMAGEKDETKKNKLYISLLVLAVASTVLAAIFIVSGIIS